LPARECAGQPNGLSGGARQVQITRHMDQLKAMENNENNSENNTNVDAIMALFGPAASGTIDPANIFDGLTEATPSDIKRLRNWAQAKGCSLKDFDRAARNWRIKSELGSIPQSAEEFVLAFTKKNGIEPEYDGSLRLPWAEDRFAIDYTRADLLREVLLANDRLRAGFDKTIIGHAVDAWIAQVKPIHLAKVWAIINDPEAPRCSDEWATLIGAIVDAEAVSPGYAIATIQKFMWQVKRKMKNLPVSAHLMPVLCGEQGNGKSTFVCKMLEPLHGIDRMVSFGEITDGRNIQLFDAFVLFTDEMEKAAKADIEAIKNVITATKLSRRIFHSNFMATLRQNATLIGATNGTLGSNIRDTTGLRRFAPIPTLRNPVKPGRPVDWEKINGIDFAALWRSVQINDPDPMLAHMDELTRLQEEERERSPVELWLEGLDLQTISEWDCEKDGTIKADKLFAIFRDFEQQNFPGVFRMSSQAWGREMKRLLDLDGDRAKFARKRAGDGWRYVPVRPIRQSAASIIELRDSLRKAG